MFVRTILVLFLSSFFISSCSLFTKKVQIETIPEKRVQLNLHEPEPVKLSKVIWFVVTPENIDTTFNRLKQSKNDLVLFGLSETGYQNLSTNMAVINKYIYEQKTIIKSYKKYYESTDSTESNKK